MAAMVVDRFIAARVTGSIGVWRLADFAKSLDVEKRAGDIIRVLELGELGTHPANSCSEVPG
jgi:hypothetical protein